MAKSEPTIDELKATNERLTLQKANAQLDAELEAMRVPWWRKVPLVASLTTIIAATIPVTTAVDGCYRNDRELALAEKKQAQELALAKSKQAQELALADNRQAHEIQLTYFKSYQQPGERQRTLRFVMATARDESVKKWAESELDVVGTELQSIDGQIADLQKRLSNSKLTPLERAKIEADLAQLVLLRSSQANVPDDDKPLLKGDVQARASGQGGLM